MNKKSRIPRQSLSRREMEDRGRDGSTWMNLNRREMEDKKRDITTWVS